jgi:hypothetical protein
MTTHPGIFRAIARRRRLRLPQVYGESPAPLRGSDPHRRRTDAIRVIFTLFSSPCCF